jgi:hypothetical protein
MATKSKRHIHKYYRDNESYMRCWACGLPDCSHYMPPHIEKQIVGKQSICWQCGEVFILDSEALKEIRPRCIACRTGIDSAEDFPLSAEMKQRLGIV